MDTAILLWIQENLRCEFSECFFSAVTFLGDKGLIWLLTAGIMLFFPSYRKWGITIICALAITALTGEIILKNLVERPRPFTQFSELELLISAPDSFSFPSGHSASSFAAATVLFHCRKSFGIPAFILAGLIAFSRLFLFVHYPSDVLAGSCLGCIIACLICFLFRKYWNLQPVWSKKQL